MIIPHHGLEMEVGIAGMLSLTVKHVLKDGSPIGGHMFWSIGSTWGHWELFTTSETGGVDFSRYRNPPFIYNSEPHPGKFNYSYPRLSHLT